MTPREKLARAKTSLMELAEYLQSVSESCRVMRLSRQHFKRPVTQIAIPNNLDLMTGSVKFPDKAVNPSGTR